MELVLTKRAMPKGSLYKFNKEETNLKSKHKALLLIMCAVLLVATSAFGTLAYLTDKDTATNTFTVGSVGLKLDEADVNPDGTYVKDHDTRVQENEYHLLPGHTYYKDPTVTVDAGSEAAYVRMIVTVENIGQLQAALPDAKYYGTDGTFLLQSLCGGWDPAIWVYEGYTAEGNNGIYEFRYKETVAKSENATVLPDLFKTITVPGEIDNDHLAYLKDVKIVVNAHAIQADGFKTAEEAWSAFSN